MANERQQLRSACEAAEAGFRFLFETSSVALMWIEDGQFSDCNPAALKLFGVPDKPLFCALQASDLSPLQQSDGQLSGPLLEEHLAAARRQREYRCNWQFRRLDNGEEFPCELVLQATPPGQHAALLMAVHVRSSKEDEENLAELAYHDQLTHLPNRRLFHDRLINVLAQSRRYRHHAAVIVIGIDTPPPAWSVGGAEEPCVADRLRCEAARRISAGLRSADTLACLNRDDFVVLLGDLAEDPLTATAQAHRVADKILARLAPPCTLSMKLQDGSSKIIEHAFVSGLGVAVFIENEMLAEALMQQAIDAMKLARAEGDGLVRLAPRR